MPFWRGIRKSASSMNFRTPMFRARSAPSGGKTWRCCSTPGIDVLTTMNIQHLESLNDQVWHITGIRVRETIPDWVVRQADEVVMVDLTPRALLHRLERGVVYGREKAAAGPAELLSRIVPGRAAGTDPARSGSRSGTSDREPMTRAPGRRAKPQRTTQTPQDPRPGDGRSEDRDGDPARQARQRFPRCRVLRRRRAAIRGPERFARGRAGGDRAAPEFRAQPAYRDPDTRGRGCRLRC